MYRQAQCQRQLESIVCCCEAFSVHCLSSLLPLRTLLITGLISDHVVTTCYFLPSKRFCLKVASLCEFSISTNSPFFIEYACRWFIDCLKLIVCDILLSWVCFYFVCSMFACNSVRLSLKSIKGNLLTYLLY